MRRWLPAALAVLAAAGLLVFQLRKASPARHVGGIAYEMKCRNCSARCRLTTEDMNRMIDRGEALSPPEEVRRFTCRECGKLELTFDNTGYERMRDAPAGQP